MKRSKAKNMQPQIRLVGWEAQVRAAVVAAGLASGTALAAPGDLDPSFGDVGRRSGIEMPTLSSLWSVDVQDDDSVIFGGGGEYDYYSWYEDFLGRLTPDGAPDAGFVAPTFDRTVIYDTALQPDGKVIGAGMARQPDGSRKLLLFRLLPSGALDTTFGLNGLAVISDGTSGREVAYSVVLDPGGEIVVAGERSGKLLVARATANGVLDAGFGTGGVFTGPEVNGGTMRIARVPTGGYRVIAWARSAAGWGCTVAGLTASGVLDAAFGAAGYASPPTGTAGSPYCTALAVQADGQAVIGGAFGASPFVGRLLANGAKDPGFDASAAAGPFQSVSAVGVGPTGNIFVAGTDRTGFSGALVVRLLANGMPDTLFGRDGATLVQPQVRTAQSAWVTDMKVGADNRLVVGGNSYSWAEGIRGFVARLRGDSGGAGPGVFSITRQRVLATEGDGQVALTVQRNGGSEGPVAVSYATSSYPLSGPGGSSYSPGAVATVEDDYTAATGRLTWADGDVSEREIVVPIKSDASVERPEWFEVVLQSPEGGAGLGYFGASVEIAGSSYPHGDFSIFPGSDTVAEGDTASFFVSRDYYAQGAVSVTVRVASGGTATAGADFRRSGSTWEDIVLNWADGESGSKYVPVLIVADGSAESAETFTLELTAPTGGGLVGAPSQASMQITSQASPPPANPPTSRNTRGGGSFGWLGAMLLGLAGAVRRYRRPHGGALKA